MNKDEIIKEIKDVTKMCLNKGWGERNAGNISYRLDNDDPFINDFIYEKELDIDVDIKEFLNNKFAILISHSGSKFRDITADPLSHFGVIKVVKNKILYYAMNDLSLPSSELLSHLHIHTFLNKTKIEKKAIFHTHPTSLIAFSHKFNHYNADKLNEILESIMPEVNLFIPEKTGFVDLLPAGSMKLAKETLTQLQRHNLIVWKKHGVLSIEKNLWEAFDSIDIIDKAAKIVLMANILI